MREKTDQDLLAYALGQLDAAARERVERARADDPEVDRRLRAMDAHLGRWDALEAPPPPPFARIAARLEAARRPVGAWPVWAAAGLLVLLLAGVHLLGRRADEAAALGRAGEGVYVLGGDGDRLAPPGGRVGAGDLLGADEPAEVRIGTRARIVLDAAARLRLDGPEEVRLEAGRAFFEVEGGAFRVVTPAGPVEVTGTAFEVALTEGGLEVSVLAGRVEAAGHVLTAGEGLFGGRVGPLRSVPGGFFRRPVLLLAADASRLRTGAPVTLVFTFRNESRFPVDLAGPDGVRTALWLEVVTPGGQVHDLPLPTDEHLAAGRPLHLGPHEEITFRLHVQDPFRDPGVYRCRALYRPEGQASLVSDVLPLEVR